MAATESVMVPLGTPAPDFTLLDARTGQEDSLKDLRGARVTVIMFICNHCPFVKHLIDDIVKCARHYEEEEVDFIAISSNDAENYPEDSPAKMREYAEEGDYPFPYLYDESQEVAKAYKAVCTPDFFVYDSDMQLAYRGQFDDSRPGNDVKVTGADLRGAIDALLEGHQPGKHQKPSIGCNIKWKRADI